MKEMKGLRTKGVRILKDLEFSEEKIFEMASTQGTWVEVPENSLGIQGVCLDPKCKCVGFTN